MAAQPSQREVLSDSSLRQHLGLEDPALGQVLQLAAHLVQVVERQARVDILGVLLHHPHRAVRLAQQVHRRAGVPDPVAVAVDQVGRVGLGHLGHHLGRGHLAAVEQIDAIEVHDVTALDIRFVHQPVAAAVDGAHVDLELLGQPHRVHLLVAVQRDLVQIGRRVDVGPRRRPGADEGAKPAEGPSARVLGDAAVTMHSDSEFHGGSPVGGRDAARAGWGGSCRLRASTASAPTSSCGSRQTPGFSCPAQPTLRRC